MHKHYFKIFWRNFVRNKSHFLLNLLGLTLGITCFLFALLFVFYETNYDSYVLHKDRIARIVTSINSSGNETHTALSNGFLTNSLPGQFPEISRMVRFNRPEGRSAIRGKDQANSTTLENIYYTDPDVFKVFSYPLIAGDRNTCLNDPGTVVLSRKVAAKIFGRASAINQFVVLNNKTLKVTGVVEDLPGNSDLVFDGLVSMSTFIKSEDVQWVYTYVLFSSALARDSFQTKLNRFTNEQVNPTFKQADVSFQYKLEPMGSIHFSNNSVYDTPKGDRKYVDIFLVTGILILIIACTNSVNMMVVRSFSRSAETTIQKIYGASRTALITQQAMESIAIGLLAAVISFLIIWMLLPEYAVAIDRKLAPSNLFNWKILASILAALMVLGVSGAIFTGFYLQKVQFAEILRSGNSKGYKMKFVPRLMLGFQFFISIGMMVAALVVHRQVRYLKEAPLGFNPDNVLVIELPQGEHALEGDKYLKNILTTQAGVLKTSLCSLNALPGSYPEVDVFVYKENGIQVKKTVDDIEVDADYFDLLQVPVIKGDLFYDKKDSGARKNNVIVTDLFAKRAGWDHPVGEKVAMFGDETTDRVIGVVQDFHFTSLHNPVSPMIILPDPDNPAHLLAKVEQAKTGAVINTIGQEWKKAFPGLPLFYYFLDQHLQQQYRGENDLFALLLTLTSLIIVISCIGLMAYTSFIMRIAGVDIAVRRIIGASFLHIFHLFNRQFVLLLIIAFLVAAPVSWYFLHLWLDQFSYHIFPKTGDFLIGLGAISAIVTVMIVYYTWRCVRVNPAKIIREK
jgi:putative ABC transport system permease protein